MNNRLSELEAEHGSEEITKTQELAQRQFLQQFEEHALSAIKKNNPEDLTPEEASAICMFAGIPHHFEMDDHKKLKVIFEPCALVKEGDQWIAYRAQPTDTNTNTNTES